MEHTATKEPQAELEDERRYGWCILRRESVSEWDPCPDVPDHSKPCRPACEYWRTERPRREYAVVDRNTGEMTQLSLLGAQWDAYKVESLRWSLSGGNEMAKAAFDELVAGGELSPGAIVEVRARGVVKEHAPVYRKDGHEGKTVIGLEVIREITVIGQMSGPVEAAQNVDGAAKLLEASV